MLKKPLVMAICISSIVTGLSTATLFTLQLSGAVDIFATMAHIEFRNYDNTLLYKNDIPIGTYASYEGDTPTKESTDLYDYTFTTWDKPQNNVIKDTVFYAQYQNHPREFKVTFQNYNFNTLYVTYVARGETAYFIGAKPTRESDERCIYTFSGWDKPLTNIQEETTFIAQYDETPVEYRVDFRNYQGDLLYTDYVVYGQAAEYRGLTPTKEGTTSYDYVFDGWSDSIDFITEDKEVVARFKQVPVSIVCKFVNYNQTELYVDFVSFGGTADYKGPAPYREPDENYVYTFAGWDKELTNIVEETTFTATYTSEERKFVVKFYNYDDELLYTSTVRYGHEAFYNGVTPTRPMDEKYIYTFTNEWDRDLSFVTQDIVTYVVYQKTLREFTCTFLNFDGELLATEQVQYGKTAVYHGATPIKDIDVTTAYRFIGWDKDLTNITEDTVFVAQFEEYDTGGGGAGPIVQVDFRNYDGSILDYDFVRADEEATYDEEVSYLVRPDSENFHNCVFVGWSGPLTGLEKNTTVYALYQCNEGYIVQYRDVNGNLLYEEAVPENYTTSYKGDNEYYTENNSYFGGWRADDDTLWSPSLEVKKPYVFRPVYLL